MTPLGLDALSLLKQPSFSVFIVCSFLICIPLAAYYAYAPVFVGASGVDGAGVKHALGTGLRDLLHAGHATVSFVRLGVKWMLLVGMFAWIARYALFSAAAANGAFWMIMCGIVLHGICYDFFFVTGFIYTDKKAPKNVRGAAQGFLVLVTQGLGLGIGAQIVGRIANAYTTETATDWGKIWLIPCLMAAVVAVAFMVLFRENTKTRQQGESQ